MIKKISQNIGKIIRNFQGIPRKGEFTIEQYNSFLCNKYDTMYVNLLSNVLHKHLTENEIKTSLIGVGSTISGISTNNNSSFYSENSDIDFFIITKRNKIWLARFFSIFFVRMFGLRPSTESNRDAFCMSFFIEEDSLNIKNIMLHSKDIYMPYWVQQMLPIYDPDGLHQKFLEANSWFRDYLPNGYANQFSKEVKENFWTRLFGNIFGFVVSPPIISRWLNNVYRRVQTNIIDNNLKSLVNIDTRVIINEKMLKFHANDRREIFYKKWREKVSKIIKPNSELIINR